MGIQINPARRVETARIEIHGAGGLLNTVTSRPAPVGRWGSTRPCEIEARNLRLTMPHERRSRIISAGHRRGPCTWVSALLRVMRILVMRMILVRIHGVVMSVPGISVPGISVPGV